MKTFAAICVGVLAIIGLDQFMNISEAIMSKIGFKFEYILVILGAVGIALVYFLFWNAKKIREGK